MSFYNLEDPTSPEKRKEGETCEWVDDEADDHGAHRDEDPMWEPLVLHAAVDSNGCLMALEQTQMEICTQYWEGSAADKT